MAPLKIIDHWQLQMFQTSTFKHLGIIYNSKIYQRVHFFQKRERKALETADT